MPVYWLVSKQETIDFVKLKIHQVKTRFGYFWDCFVRLDQTSETLKIKKRSKSEIIKFSKELKEGRTIQNLSGTLFCNIFILS